MNLAWRRAILMGGDWFLFYFSLGLALWVRQAGSVSLYFYLQHLGAFSAVFSVWLLVFYVLGLYEFRHMRSLVALIRDCLLALVVNTAAAIGMFYLFSGQLGMTPKTHLILTALFAHITILLWRHEWVRILSSKILLQRVAFLGDNPLIQMMVCDLRTHPQLGFKVVPCPELGGFTGNGNGHAYWLPDTARCLGLKSFLDFLVVDADRIDDNSSLGQTPFSLAVLEDIPVMTHLDFYEVLYDKIPPHYAAKPSWLLSYVLPKGNQTYLYFKRALDLAVAALGLALLSPVIVLTVCISKVYYGHSPFYHQRRVGYLGREFMIWKFRTMVPGADQKGPLWDIVQDERVTRLGKILRRFRLDEIPQLWNVLKGEMSLVGPRPEWIQEVRVLEKTVPHYHLRHLVKSGITGWAQINFRATNNHRDWEEKLHYDLYYVKNLSLALDVGILLKTLKRVFLREDHFDYHKLPSFQVTEPIAVSTAQDDA